MIYFDVTKTAAVRHRSGLARLSVRLREELGADAIACRWDEALERAGDEDWFVTTELFSEEERPGMGTFLDAKTCRTVAIFADAIPLKLPHITWPQSVARHPGYMKLLARFDRVWAISRASRDELLGYWEWLGLEGVPPVEVLSLGADLSRSERVTAPAAAPTGAPMLLCVGILEPRKNQPLLLDVSEALWAEGLVFELVIVGRVNPHFGKPTLQRIEALRRRRPGLKYLEAAPDDVLLDLYRRARATVCPTIAEGCGLPLLESLWHGVPCVCSDLPVLGENADGGGCLRVAVNDVVAWQAALREVIVGSPRIEKLRLEARARSLPRWAETAAALRKGLA